MFKNLILNIMKTPQQVNNQKNSKNYNNKVKLRSNIQ